jgi:hypothetical protein
MGDGVGFVGMITYYLNFNRTPSCLFILFLGRENQHRKLQRTWNEMCMGYCVYTCI